MRNYDKYRNTKFIQKSDVERGALVTIDKVTEENVAPDYQAEEIKYVIHFKEDYKAWAPGIEVLETIKQIAGTGNVDDWSGTKLVLFVDPNVKFGRKQVGGIRCRAPKGQPEPNFEESGIDGVPGPDPSIQNNPEYVGNGQEGICPHCQKHLEDCVCDIKF